MEFKRIEHYDIFPVDVIIFWADVSNPPEEVQSAAKEIEPWNFSPNCFWAVRQLQLRGEGVLSGDRYGEFARGLP